MSKIKLTTDQLEAYKIGNQQDLDRLQDVWNSHNQTGTPIEFEPFEGISDDVRDYLAAKGITPSAVTNEPESAAESVINVNDILEYNKLKNK